MHDALTAEVLSTVELYLGPYIDLETRFDTDNINARVDALIALQERFRVPIVEGVDRLRTVGDLVELVRRTVEA